MKVYFRYISAASVFVFTLSCASFKMGFMKPDRFIVKSLEHWSLEQQSRAIDLIVSEHPPEAVEALASEIIASRDPVISERLFKAMRLYDASKYIDQWISVLDNVKHFSLKNKVIRYLWKTESRKLVMPMARALATPNYEVRKNAALFLKKNGDDRMYPFVLNMLTSTDPLRRVYGLEALDYLYDRRFTELIINQLKDPNKSIRIYALNCIAINTIHQAVYMVRNTAQSDKNAEVRARSVEVLAQLNDARSQYVFIRMLNDKDPSVRFNSVKAIEDLKLRGAAYYLSELVKKEKRENIAGCAIDTLSDLETLGHYSGIAFALLSSPYSHIRIKAAILSGKVLDRRLVPSIKKALKDRDYRVRAEAAYSLSSYPYDNPDGNLIKVIKEDKNRYVRVSALLALKKLKNKKSVIKLYNLIDMEKDPVFRFLLHDIVGYLIKELI